LHWQSAALRLRPRQVLMLGCPLGSAWGSRLRTVTRTATHMGITARGRGSTSDQVFTGTTGIVFTTIATIITGTTIDIKPA
jgi:hypothetical protein